MGEESTRWFGQRFYIGLGHKFISREHTAPKDFAEFQKEMAAKKAAMKK